MASFTRQDYMRAFIIASFIYTLAPRNSRMRELAVELMDLLEKSLGQMTRPDRE